MVWYVSQLKDLVETICNSFKVGAKDISPLAAKRQSFIIEKKVLNINIAICKKGRS